MTLEEWQRETSPSRLLEVVSESEIGQRECRLLLSACARQLTYRIDASLFQAIELLESLADGDATQQERRDLQRTFARSRPALHQGVTGVCLSVGLQKELALSEVRNVMYRAEQSLEGRSSGKLCQMIRDIVVSFAGAGAITPDWRTSITSSLARTMYTSRNFAAMPMLGDALEEAGCDDVAILTHCREPEAVHVRGCWVVDGVLGKR